MMDDGFLTRWNMSWLSLSFDSLGWLSASAAKRGRICAINDILSTTYAIRRSKTLPPQFYLCLHLLCFWHLLAELVVYALALCQQRVPVVVVAQNRVLGEELAEGVRHG